MNDVDNALSQIADIQAQLAASTRFRGFGPEAMLLAGLLTLLAAVAQTIWPESLASDPIRYVIFWAAIIAGGAVIICTEAVSRSRWLHGRMADAMLGATLRQVLPFAATQAIVAFVVCQFAPDSAWIVPGLWQILIALVGFSAVPNLPRSIAWAAAWFFLCGTVVLILAGSGKVLSPWMMGIPFAVGHALIALVLHRAGGEKHAQN